MLAVLRIQNLAIVEEVEIEFAPGLNVITGETGAGKSIILKAIELITGKRASSELIRSGANSCIVEGIFNLTPEILEQCSSVSDEFADLAADQELLIRRVIDHSGRSKIYVNGSLATAGLLQRISVPLLDITAQHQHQTLLDPSHHLTLLDAFGVSSKLREETASAFERFFRANKDLQSFRHNAQQRLAYYEGIRLECEELNKAELSPNLREELEVEVSRFANVENLSEKLNSCLGLVENNDPNLEQQFRSLNLLLEQSVEMDPKLEEARMLAESASVQLTETKLLLSEYGAMLEADPERLEYLRERLSDIARLERKYGKPVPELIRYLDQIREEIAEYESAGFDEKKLSERVEQAREVLNDLERRLTAERKKVAAKLSKSVEKELTQLSMKRARFRVQLTPHESTANGADQVEFMLAANPGEEFRPLAKVASGGELSRILLVLKTLFNARTEPGTQIFDEIDAGIGGSVAQIVGEKLRQVAQASQVILVTHAPQIAALAEHHLFISKTSSKDRTRVQVKPLNQQGRIEQLASMLAGREVTSKFHESAKELLRLKG